MDPSGGSPVGPRWMVLEIFFSVSSFILDQNEFCFTVLTDYQPLESMQIMRKSHLINLFKTLLLYTGSGKISLLTAALLLDIF